jgi:hypothetical protein
LGGTGVEEVCQPRGEWQAERAAASESNVDVARRFQGGAGAALE